MAELIATDDAERERIRRALKRYKELHGGIGDPELRGRIEKALSLPVRLSTLQRFLRGTHRTDDVPVHRYRRFLSKVAPPPASDELGAALSRFLLTYPQEEAWNTTFAGDYQTFVRPHEAKANDPSGFTVGCSMVRLKAGANSAFLHATEFMSEPEQEITTPEIRSQAPWLGNTGIFAPVGRDQYLLIVRSLLELRLYLLRKVNSAPLTLYGHVMQPTSASSVSMKLPGVRQKQPVSEFVMIAVRTDEKQA